MTHLPRPKPKEHYIGLRVTLELRERIIARLRAENKHLSQWLTDLIEKALGERR